MHHARTPASAPRNIFASRFDWSESARSTSRIAAANSLRSRRSNPRSMPRVASTSTTATCGGAPVWYCTTVTSSRSGRLVNSSKLTQRSVLSRYHTSSAFDPPNAYWLASGMFIWPTIAPRGRRGNPARSAARVSLMSSCNRAILEKSVKAPRSSGMPVISCGAAGLAANAASLTTITSASSAGCAALSSPTSAIPRPMLPYSVRAGAHSG